MPLPNAVPIPAAADTILARAGLDPERRPETLSPEAFAALLRARS